MVGKRAHLGGRQTDRLPRSCIGHITYVLLARQYLSKWAYPTRPAVVALGLCQRSGALAAPDALPTYTRGPVVGVTAP